MPEVLQSQEPASQNGFHTVRFGEFEADLKTGEIRRSGSRIKLQDQPFKVLQILLENPGGVVSREELQSRIWPEVSFGDFDHAVNVAVGKLRTALGDSAESSSFIETIPRRGYRFIATVQGPPALNRLNGAASQATPTEGQGPRKTFRARQAFFVFLGVASCGALLAAGVWLGRRSARSQPVELQRLTVMRGTVYSARFAPDGHTVIYAASWEGAPTELYATDPKFPGPGIWGCQTPICSRSRPRTRWPCCSRRTRRL